MLVSKVFSIESDHVRRAADKARLLTASDWRRSCHYQMVTDDELLLWVCCPELPCLLPWCIARDSNQNERLKIVRPKSQESLSAVKKCRELMDDDEATDGAGPSFDFSLCLTPLVLLPPRRPAALGSQQTLQQAIHRPRIVMLETVHKRLTCSS